MPKSNNVLLEKSKEKKEIAHLYNVILFNDDFTPADFVVNVLMHVFGYDPNMAVDTMLYIDGNGQGIVFTGTMQEAYEKTDKVDALNASLGFSLACTVEMA